MLLHTNKKTLYGVGVFAIALFLVGNELLKFKPGYNVKVTSMYPPCHLPEFMASVLLPEALSNVSSGSVHSKLPVTMGRGPSLDPVNYNYAYVLFSYTGYVTPVFSVVKSLIWTGTCADIVLMVTPGVTSSMDPQDVIDLEILGVKLLEVEVFEVDHPNKERFAKLSLWTLTQYAQIVYLDMDTVITQNIDHLFQLPFKLGAVPNMWWPSRTRWRNKAATFNSGMMVLRPEQLVFAALKKQLPRFIRQGSEILADQPFLNDVFRSGSWAVLPVGYNGLKRVSNDPRKFNTKSMYMIHYTGTKPWENEEWMSYLANHTLTHTTSLHTPDPQTQDTRISDDFNPSGGFDNLTLLEARGDNPVVLYDDDDDDAVSASHGGGASRSENSALSLGGGSSTAKDSTLLGGGGTANDNSTLLGGRRVAGDDTAVVQQPQWNRPDRAFSDPFSYALLEAVWRKASIEPVPLRAFTSS